MKVGKISIAENEIAVYLLKRGQVAVITKHPNPTYVGTMVYRVSGNILVRFDADDVWGNIFETTAEFKVRPYPPGTKIELESIA